LIRPDRLRAVREQRGLSQRDLARLLGLGINQITRYEGGANEPSASVLAMIARELKVTTDYLVGLSDDPGGHNAPALQPHERQLLDAYTVGDSAAIFKLVTDRLRQLEGQSNPDAS
jgi:transcriptional regulator with XRE-family HTH domain